MFRGLMVIPNLVVLTAALGCATSPASLDREPARPVASADEPTDFYKGDPEVIFATEFPVASAEDAIERADLALQERKTDLALYLYVRAFDLDRTSVYALMRIGQIHDSRGNSALAARAYTNVLAVEPEQPAALQALGLIRLQAGQHDEALELLERAVAQQRTLWRAHNGIGVIADIKGDHSRAIAAYGAALETRPQDPSLLNNRGYSFYLNGDYSAAARDLSAAAALGVERAWVNLGLVLARQSRYAEAVEMVARTEKAEVAYNDVGYIAMRQGDHGVAETYFNKAIQIAPRYFTEAHRNLDELREIRASDLPASKATIVQLPSSSQR